MPIRTKLTERLGVIHPIVQAPLAGGADTPELVAAVGEAGGIGFIGAAYLTPARIAEAASAVRARTKRPFGINLFAPAPPVELPADAAKMLDRVAPFFAELGLPPPALPQAPAPSFPEQLAAVLDTGAAAFSFTFGMLPPDAIAAAKAKGIFVMGTATTVEEAVLLEHAGVDTVVVQGSEAGGHRGTFATSFENGMIGTMALVPQAVDAVKIPVLASGGIMDGRGIAASIALGAAGVQMGTAFLTCAESGVPEAYREAILRAREHQTRITRAFSGRSARGIVNRFMTEVERPGGPEPLPFPLQNVLTRSLRDAANKQGRAEYLSLWAGQGLGLARRQSAGALVERLAAETERVIAELRGALTT
jgi:nitronate monooxygenase